MTQDNMMTDQRRDNVKKKWSEKMGADWLSKKNTYNMIVEKGYWRAMQH